MLKATKKAPVFVRELTALIGRFVTNVRCRRRWVYCVSIPYRKVRNYEDDGYMTDVHVSIPYRKVRNA